MITAQVFETPPIERGKLFSYSEAFCEGGPYPLADLDRGVHIKGGPNPLGHRHIRTISPTRSLHNSLRCIRTFRQTGCLDKLVYQLCVDEGNGRRERDIN